MESVAAIPPDTRPQHRGAVKRYGLIVSAAAMLASGLVLYLFEPTQVRFYPQCVFHTWTGLACPGCGGLRSAHQLLHGHILAAIRYNALFVSLIPALVVGCAQTFYASLTWRDSAELRISPRVGWLLLWTTILFSIVRNLPIYPFPPV
jgi:hypothetical protein